MKFFVFLACVLASLGSLAADVPDVGSVWESTSVYASKGDGSPPVVRQDVVRVERLEAGRPVFSGKVFGHAGEIVEAKDGTLVYADECKQYVTPEELEPPSTPNQCVWHMCYPPAVGETFTRKLFVFAPIFACAKQEASYEFFATRTEVYEGKDVTVGTVTIMFRGLRRSFWESYIRSGMGEVYGEALDRVTTYEKVEVPLVPYKRVTETALSR